MKVVSLFQTRSTGKLVDLGLLAARLGLGFSFIWPGINKVSNPAGIAGMLQSMGMGSEAALSLSLMIGVLEIFSGALISIGLVTRLSAIFQIIILVGAQVIFGFNYTQGPAIWKDPGLLGIAILLLFAGSGKLGIDGIISRRHQKTRV